MVLQYWCILVCTVFFSRTNKVYIYIYMLNFYLGGRCRDELRLVINPAMRTKYSPVCLAEVADQRGIVDPAWTEGTIILTGDPEGQHLWVDGPAAPIPFLWGPKGAAMRRGCRNKVVQKKMKGQDGTRQAEDNQYQRLKFTEATNFIQDLFKPHVELSSVSVTGCTGNLSVVWSVTSF